MMKFCKLLISLLILNSCATDELTEKVIKEDKMGIKDRESAIKFYLEKKIIGKYQLTKDNDLVIFDCSGVDWISDDEVKYIVFFPEVKAIYLSGKNITDKSFFYFKNFSQLRSIYITDTSVTGSGFKYIQNNTHLGGIDFSRSPVTDDGIMLLSTIQYTDVIDLLNISNTKITDEGMKYIAKMKFGKAYISLFNTKVTDEGIKYLAGFKELKEIDLRETKVTDKGGKWLREQLPNTEIYWGKYIPDTPTGMDQEE